MVAALICLVGGQIVSYVKARAEGLGLTCDVGIAERAERLIIVGVGALLTGRSGSRWGLPAALWVLAAATVVTVGQRIVHVHREAGAARVSRLVDLGYAAGWRLVRTLPRPVAAAAFRAAADSAARRPRSSGTAAGRQPAPGGRPGPARGRAGRAGARRAALVRPLLAGGVPAARR